MEKLVEQLGVMQLSKSQVSEMAQHLDVQVEAFRSRPLDSGHYTFVWLDALAVKVRDGVSGSQTRFGYAACKYSLISPPRIGRRWIFVASRSMTFGGGFGGC